MVEGCVAVKPGGTRRLVLVVLVVLARLAGTGRSWLVLAGLGFWPASGRPRASFDQILPLRSFPAENFTVFDFLILILAPVFGLIPMRAARSATLNVPKPMS